MIVAQKSSHVYGDDSFGGTGSGILGVDYWEGAKDCVS